MTFSGAWARAFPRGTPRDPQRLTELASLWLRAERVRHLVVTGAERRPPEDWATLGRLCEAADPPLLWLVVSERPRRQQSAALHPLRLSTLDVERLGFVLAPTTSPPVADPDERSDYPPVPDSDFPFFPSVCVDRLPEPAARQALDTFARGRHFTYMWIRRHPRPTRAQLRAFLGTLIAPCASADAALARLRGA